MPGTGGGDPPTPRSTARRSRPEATGDAELLNRFVRHRDQEAFTLLVRRHGPMVLSVCRRVTAQPRMRKRHSRPCSSSSPKGCRSPAREPDRNWLYGVAVRVAQKARRSAAPAAVVRSQSWTCPKPAASPTDPPTDVWPGASRGAGQAPGVVSGRCHTVRPPGIFPLGRRSCAPEFRKDALQPTRGRPEEARRSADTAGRRFGRGAGSRPHSLVIGVIVAVPRVADRENHGLVA